MKTHLGSVDTGEEQTSETLSPVTTIKGAQAAVSSGLPFVCFKLLR